MKLEISLLGAFRLQREGSPDSSLESDKVRALLAYLVVESDRPHRREALAGLFWPDVPEARARHSLSQALYNLRVALADRANPSPFFLISLQSLQFNLTSDVSIDVKAFTRLLDEADQHRHGHIEGCDTCLQTLTVAADLYRGNFLEALSLPDSLGFEEWALGQRERLRLRALGVLGRMARAHELRGAYAEALGYARLYVALEAFDEEGHQQVMRLLALMGNRNAALRQYKTCRLILEEELGVTPNRDTEALAERIRRGDLDQELGTVWLGNLPATLTPFVGRAPELAEIRGLLADPDCRLVTLLGPGGSGKTRLALEVVGALSYDYRDGVHLVPLSAVTSPEGLVPAIAAGIGFMFQEGGDPGVQLREYLRSRQLLLVLDSFETVTDGAQQVAELLHAAPQVKILVTSRVRLNLKGEYVFPVEGLRYPGAGFAGEAGEYSAVDLFVKAAQRVDPDFALTVGTRVQVGEICRLVGGMPLGVVLATIWVGTYSLEEIAAEIQRNLDFLNVGWVDVPERQRSLRATFEYSWGLLTERERELVGGLAVFQGRISRNAAEAVVGGSGPELLKLVDKTMLGVVETGWYQMHDLIRQYALEKLAAEPEMEAAVRERHSAYYCGLAEGWGRELKSTRQAKTLVEMDGEIENLRAGCLWAAEQRQVNRLWEALEGLCLYYDLRFRLSEGAGVCAQALAALGDSAQRLNLAATVRAGLLVRQARFHRQQGDTQVAGELLSVVDAQLNQLGERDKPAHQVLALLQLERGYLVDDLRARLMSGQISADLYRGLGEDWWLVQVLYWLAETYNRLGFIYETKRINIEAIERARSAGEPRALARTMQALAFMYAYTGEIQKMLVSMQEAANIYQTFDNLALQMLGAYCLGVANVWNGRFGEACSLLEDGLESFQEQGNQYLRCFTLMSLGIVYIQLGEAALAWDRLREGMALAIKGGYRREQAAILSTFSQLALLERDSDQACSLAQESLAIYRQISYVYELVPVLSALAIAQCQLDRLPEAADSLTEALRVGIESGHYVTGIFGLPAVALLLARLGREDRAAEVLAQALQEPVVSNSHWYPVVLGEPLLAAARQRMAAMNPPLDDEERLRRVIATASTLLEELAG